MERPDFWKTRLDEVDAVMETVKKGKVSVVTKSAGGRNVYLVEYGEKQDFNRTANYSSALGGGSPKHYADRTGKKPVIFIIGAEHGGEVEGTVAILNMIRMIETGKDFRGNTNPFFLECIKDCRLLLIPIANPDGRARMDIDTFHGLPYERFRHYAQGRWKDGTLCEYPRCKTIHPIKDYVSFLGAYFNDDGVNLAHDDFFGDKAKETQAIFETADRESPDFTLHLHGGGNVINEIAHPDYMPLYVKERIQELKLRVKSETEKLGLATLVNEIREDNVYPPRTFNLYSALHFVCGTISVIYESNEGLDYTGHRELNPEWETLFTCEEIMNLHYILFEQTIRLAQDLRAQQVL
jgi:hypothetical protein